MYYFTVYKKPFEFLVGESRFWMSFVVGKRFVVNFLSSKFSNVLKLTYTYNNILWKRKNKKNPKK